MSKTDITVQELVNKVRHGELALPEMQRRYVWPATRVRDLLDSLYRSYPSGTILVWETDEDIVTKEIAVKATQSPTTSQRQLLLDGQQRITSLASVLDGQPVHVRNRKKPIEILFNLEHPKGPPLEVTEVEENNHADEGEDNDDDDAAAADRDIQEEIRKRVFVVASGALQNDPLWVPVSKIFKETDKELLKPLGINSDDERWDKYTQRLQQVRKIRDYPYVMQVLEKNLSYEEVTEIFVRVNSLGIKLRGSDLALAQITSRWKGFMAEIEKFSAEFKDDADYIIESGLPVRTLVIFATEQCRFKTVGRISRKEFEPSWEKAKQGLRFAINFLRSNADIDSLSHLSSPFLIIPIAVYASLKNEQLSPDDNKELLRWFYLAHMRGHYGMGSSETILDQDLTILFKKSSLKSLLQQLQLHVKKFEVDENDLAKKGIRSPFFSMLYFVLKKKGAKDWWSGLALSKKHVGKSHAIQYHHIFPKALLHEKPELEKQEINEIANIAFISGRANRHIHKKAPIQYFDEEIIAKKRIEALTSQIIPMEKNLWEIANYRDFLTWRRRAIAGEITQFMKQFDN